MSETTKFIKINRNSISKILNIGQENVVRVMGIGAPAGAPAGGDRGMFGGGNNGSTNTDTLDYIPISTTGNAVDFGNLTVGRHAASSTSNGANDRGVWAGGFDPGWTQLNVIDYITISTPGDATDFGDLTVARIALAGTSNGTNNRGVFGGNNNGPADTIDYITISATGDATDFGNLTTSRYYTGALSNGTNERGVFGGGLTTVNVSTIDYITINSAGNATAFGDLTIVRQSPAGVSNGTNERGVFGGGRTNGPAESDVMDYITISTPGNAADFGDLTQARSYISVASNMTNERGVFAGGYISTHQDTMDYITINSLGNAIDFGDLTVARYGLAGCSNA